MRTKSVTGVQGILNELALLKHEAVTPGTLEPHLALLQAWQARRLAATYADVAGQPRYRAIMEFFLEDVYGPRDYSQRNHDMLRLHELLSRVAPEPVVRPLVLTVELHDLTERLDRTLLEALESLGMTDELASPLYAEAYRKCDNYADRARQIELIRLIGNQIDAAVHVPFSGAMLVMARTALQRGGWSELSAFMDRGYRVFKPVRDTKALFELIYKREMGILDRIYSSDPNPFDLAKDSVQ